MAFAPQPWAAAIGAGRGPAPGRLRAGRTIIDALVPVAVSERHARGVGRADLQRIAVGSQPIARRHADVRPERDAAGRADDLPDASSDGDANSAPDASPDGAPDAHASPDGAPDPSPDRDTRPDALAGEPADPERVTCLR
jgi:hypothetical protein